VNLGAQPGLVLALLALGTFFTTPSPQHPPRSISKQRFRCTEHVTRYHAKGSSWTTTPLPRSDASCTSLTIPGGPHTHESILPEIKRRPPDHESDLFTWLLDAAAILFVRRLLLACCCQIEFYFNRHSRRHVRRNIELTFLQVAFPAPYVNHPKMVIPLTFLLQSILPWSKEEHDREGQCEDHQHDHEGGPYPAAYTMLILDLLQEKPRYPDHKTENTRVHSAIDPRRQKELACREMQLGRKGLVGTSSLPTIAASEGSSTTKEPPLAESSGSSCGHQV
jgi:hypothetical protein